MTWGTREETAGGYVKKDDVVYARRDGKEVCERMEIGRMERWGGRMTDAMDIDGLENPTDAREGDVLKVWRVRCKIWHPGPGSGD
eukprot:jgi/Mesen1/10188/ME000076S09694